MNTAYLSIGTNMGDREHHLNQAITLLQKTEGIASIEASSVYETTPVGYTNQADFLNMVVCVTTSLAPHELLLVCQSIEQELGRVRTIRWGPRTADLDILLYNNDNIETETLTVPHPRMHERGFVLHPLTELSPTCADPITGIPYREQPAMKESGISLWRQVGEE